MTSAHGELAATLSTIAAALDGLSVPWAIGGSFASTVYGEPRATNDVDVVALLRREHVARFLDALGPSFYADADSIRAAITRWDSFNVIDERSFLKVDIFVPPPGPMGAGQLDRRRRYALAETGPVVSVLGPEDTVLQKLRWYRLGGEVSDRQWRDVLSVLRLTDDLDLGYLRTVAHDAGLEDILQRALDAAGRGAGTRP